MPRSPWKKLYEENGTSPPPDVVQAQKAAQEAKSVQPPPAEEILEELPAEVVAEARRRVEGAAVRLFEKLMDDPDAKEDLRIIAEDLPKLLGPRAKILPAALARLEKKDEHTR